MPVGVSSFQAASKRARTPQPTPGAAGVLEHIRTAPSAELIDHIAQIRQRRCTVITFDPHTYPTAPCGAWLEATDTDFILVSGATSGFYRDHVILHELSHMLLEHTASQDLGEIITAIGAMPDLSPQLISRILGRQTYDDAQERDAELLASQILATTRGDHRSAWIFDPVLRRAAETFTGVR